MENMAEMDVSAATATATAAVPKPASTPKLKKKKKVDERSDIESDMATMFIMDLMRQKKEKVLRMKKDEMINEMARKQREKMMEERNASAYRVSNGTGFVGVQQLMQQPTSHTGKTFHFKKRKHKWEEEEEEQQKAGGGN